MNRYEVKDATQIGESGYDVLSDDEFIGNYATLEEAEKVAADVNRRNSK